jgi:hypothetical protein
MRYDLHASRVSRQSGRHKQRNLVPIGGGSGVGTTIGGVAGGPVGALIGAGARSAAGTVGAAIYQRTPLSCPGPCNKRSLSATPPAPKNPSTKCANLR